MITSLKDTNKAVTLLSEVLEDSYIQQGKEALLSHFQEHKDEYSYLCSENNELEGVLCYERDTFHIIFLVVKKEFQRNDIGSSLLDELKETAQKNNIARITVNVFAQDKPFYISNGFEDVIQTNSTDALETSEMEYLIDRNMLGKTVTVIIDKHYGDFHPMIEDTQYPYNAGYIKEDITQEDASFQDAYVIGVNENIDEFTGFVCGIIYHKDEENSKWIVAPIGMNVNHDEVIQLLGLEEQFHDSRFIWSE